MINDLPGLMNRAADLLEKLHGVSSIRVIFQHSRGGSIRLLINNGQLYTYEVCDIDLISVAIGGQIDHVRTAPLGSHVMSEGSWSGVPVTASHLYFHEPPEAAGKKLCIDSAARTSDRLRQLSVWADQPWTRLVESLHVFDEDGSPRIHVVLVSGPDMPLEDAAAELMNATGLLQHASQGDHAAYGSVLMADGTALSISSIRP